jgi:hypothetical protein
VEWGRKGPLFEQGSVKTFDLAVGAGGVRPDEDGLGSNLSQGLVVVAAIAIGPGVVGHDRLEMDVAFAKPGQGSPEEAADGDSFLIVEQLAVGQACVVIYQRVNAFIANLPALALVSSR